MVGIHALRKTGNRLARLPVPGFPYHGSAVATRPIPLSDPRQVKISPPKRRGLSTRVASVLTKGRDEYIQISDPPQAPRTKKISSSSNITPLFTIDSKFSPGPDLAQLPKNTNQIPWRVRSRAVPHPPYPHISFPFSSLYPSNFLTQKNNLKKGIAILDTLW